MEPNTGQVIPIDSIKVTTEVVNLMDTFGGTHIGNLRFRFHDHREAGSVFNVIGMWCPRLIVHLEADPCVVAVEVNVPDREAA